MPISGILKNRPLQGRRAAYFLLLHVGGPLLLGLVFYLFFRQQQSLFEQWIGWSKPRAIIRFPSFIGGWLPDFLWCYSFLSYQSFVWCGWRNAPVVWKLLLYVLIPSTELLQFLHILPGTGDVGDLCCYFLAFIIHYKNQQTIRL